MTDILEVREYCLAKPSVVEEEPFGPGTITYKVCGKIFLFCPLDVEVPSIAIKGEPERLVELREQYADVTTGPYLNPKHWTTIHLTGSVPGVLVRELIDESYRLVVKGLPKALRETLQG
jgi:predicted DNA-binding protein (MmcQ/YjbR family)